MLSRVAESLMWMSRYLERASSLARIVESIEELSLDSHHPDLSNEEAFWSPVYDILDAEHEKELYIKEGNEDEIIHHLLIDRKNFSSVSASVSAARFNARGIRDQITDEIWEVINDLHLYCESFNDGEKQLNVAEFGAKVRFSVHCYRGLVESSIKQEEGWSFLMLGMCLERADQLSRLLDLKTFMLSKDRKSLGLLEPYVWLILMKVSGNKTGGFGSAQADWKKMESSLIFDLVNPNSVRFSVRKANQVLHNLSGTRRGIFSNAAERSCGKLQADLDYLSFDGLGGKDLHEYLDLLQLKIGQVFSGILDTFTHKPEDNTSVKPEQKQSQS